MEQLTHEEFQRKLTALQDDRAVAAKLRTNLRALLFSEVQSRLPSAGVLPVTIRGRALGALIVEWLQMHNCHYTLSVFVSEMPSLADLPFFAEKGSTRRYQVDELREILAALGLDNCEITDDYVNGTDSLLTCILSAAGSWQKRLEFKETLLPIPENEPKEWFEQLRTILASTSMKTDQLTSVYQSLVMLYKKQLDAKAEEEREFYQQQLVLREKQTQIMIKKQEHRYKNKLSDVKKTLELCQAGNTEEQTDQKIQLLMKLLETVRKQHQAVVEGLSIVEERERQLAEKRHQWLLEVEEEKRKRIESLKQQESAQKVLEIRESALRDLSSKPQSRSHVSKEKRMTTIGTITDDLPVLNKPPTAFKSTTVLPRGNSSTSDSCLRDDVLDAKKRLRELRAEATVAKDAVLRYCAKLEDSDHSESSLSSFQPPLIRTTSNLIVPYQVRTGLSSSITIQKLPKIVSLSHHQVHEDNPSSSSSTTDRSARLRRADELKKRQKMSEYHRNLSNVAPLIDVIASNTKPFYSSTPKTSPMTRKEKEEENKINCLLDAIRSPSPRLSTLSSSSSKTSLNRSHKQKTAPTKTEDTIKSISSEKVQLDISVKSPEAVNRREVRLESASASPKAEKALKNTKEEIQQDANETVTTKEAILKNTESLKEIQLEADPMQLKAKLNEDAQRDLAMTNRDTEGTGEAILKKDVESIEGIVKRSSFLRQLMVMSSSGESEGEISVKNIDSPNLWE